MFVWLFTGLAAGTLCGVFSASQLILLLCLQLVIFEIHTNSCKIQLANSQWLKLSFNQFKKRFRSLGWLSLQPHEARIGPGRLTRLKEEAKENHLVN